MESRKLSSIDGRELDDTPLYFTDDIGIVFGPPTDYPSRFSCGRPLWFTCVVLSGYFPCKVTIDSDLNYDYLVVKNDDTKNG
jgi:hypothetical protein